MTYNNSNSILLIPPTVSFDLANSEAVYAYLKRRTFEKMMRLYEYDLEEGETGDLHDHLTGTEYFPEEGGLDIERFFRDLEEFSKLTSDDPLTIENIRHRERAGLHFKGPVSEEEGNSTRQRSILELRQLKVPNCPFKHSVGWIG